MITKPPASGIKLIKEFEGCHLTAYPDSKTKGRPYTIGWGNTRKRNGSPFELGEKISQSEADSLLASYLEEVVMPQLKLIPHYAEMSGEQVGALMSFAYNLGERFYGSEGFATITRRLRNKEWDMVPEALELYCNPGTDVEAGLRRRRKAEGALWSKGVAKDTAQNQQIIALQDTMLKKEPLQSYELAPTQRLEVAKGKGYQVLSIISDGTHSRVVLDYGAGVWYIYNSHWRVQGVRDVIYKPGAHRILQVKYFPQRDSATTHALRMCFSSSCAMMADFLKPDAIQVAQQEDDYYMRNYVFKYGDTTDPNAQIKALRDLGVTAQYRQNLSEADIIAQIDKGIPVPIGILHHGPVSAPRGGGHWVCIVGYDRSTGHYIAHDPYGELDNINGGYYGSTNGAWQRYSFKNLNRRWMVNADGTYALGKGWGIIAASW